MLLSNVSSYFFRKSVPRKIVKCVWKRSNIGFASLDDTKTPGWGLFSGGGAQETCATRQYLPCRRQVGRLQRLIVATSIASQSDCWGRKTFPKRRRCYFTQTLWRLVCYSSNNGNRRRIHCYRRGICYSPHCNVFRFFRCFPDTFQFENTASECDVIIKPTLAC